VAEELRGAPYLLPYSEVTRRTAEAWDRGATEVCMQGGIHPDFTGEPLDTRLCRPVFGPAVIITWRSSVGQSWPGFDMVEQVPR
jgi:2-iminoacetate synthase ThiH